MLKRLAARGKQPPGPVSPVVTQGGDQFDLPEPSAENTSPVSPGSIFLVTVYTLDDEQKPLEINVQKDSDGQWLFEEACEQLGGVQEKDYFGLRFIDREKQRQWVDTTRNIYRQLKHMHPCCVSFRVKHYPPSPIEDLKQEISRYFLFLQIKRDILHSRLLCQGNEAYELAAYIAQIDLGDHDDMDDPETYLNDYKILPNQSPKSESKIAEIHKTLKGLVPSEAEAKFLTLASKMETYGIDPYSVKDQKGNVLYLGLTHVGVVTFQGSRRAHIFKWADITKFNYDGKLFIIHVTFREDNQFKRKTWLNRLTKKHILGFKCESQSAALSLWRWAVDRYCFFTLKRSSEAKRSKSGGGLLRRSHTFRFSGRCHREALGNSLSLLTLPQPTFTRNFNHNLTARRAFSANNIDQATPLRASSFRREDRMQPLTIDTDRFATFPRTRKDDEADQVLTAASSDTRLEEQGVGTEPISLSAPHYMSVKEEMKLQLRPKERPLIGKIRKEQKVEEWEEEEEEVVIERTSIINERSNVADDVKGSEKNANMETVKVVNVRRSIKLVEPEKIIKVEEIDDHTDVPDTDAEMPVTTEIPPHQPKTEVFIDPAKVETLVGQLNQTTPTEEQVSAGKPKIPSTSVKEEAQNSPVKVDTKGSPVKSVVEVSPLKVEVRASLTKEDVKAAPLQMETDIRPVKSVVEDSLSKAEADVTPVDVRLVNAELEVSPVIPEVVTETCKTDIQIDAAETDVVVEPVKSDVRGPSVRMGIQVDNVVRGRKKEAKKMDESDWMNELTKDIRADVTVPEDNKIENSTDEMMHIPVEATVRERKARGVKMGKFRLEKTHVDTPDQTARNANNIEVKDTRRRMKSAGDESPRSIEKKIKTIIVRDYEQTNVIEVRNGVLVGSDWGNEHLRSRHLNNSSESINHVEDSPEIEISKENGISGSERETLIREIIEQMNRKKENAIESEEVIGMNVEILSDTVNGVEGDSINEIMTMQEEAHDYSAGVDVEEMGHQTEVQATSVISGECSQPIIRFTIAWSTFCFLTAFGSPRSSSVEMILRVKTIA